MELNAQLSAQVSPQLTLVQSADSFLQPTPQLTAKAASRPVRALRNSLLAVALLTGAVPAWCAKEAAVAEAPKTVNINTADAATLADVLKGVGLSKAEAIVAYRKEHGGFKSVEQLADVKGIGDKLVKANHDRIVVK